MYKSFSLLIYSLITCISYAQEIRMNADSWGTNYELVYLQTERTLPGTSRCEFKVLRQD